MYKISDFAKEANLSTKTLRYYDDINLFKPSYTEPFSKYRYYQTEQLKEIRLINELKEIGLPLDAIKLYLDTNDMNIIYKYKKEMEIQMKKIDKLIKQKEKVEYTLKEYDYRKYIEINGTRQASCPQALEVRDRNAIYIVIEENNRFMDDFCIYKEDNWLTLNKMYLTNDILMEYIFNYIVKNIGLTYISVIIPAERVEIIEHLKNKYQIISISEKKQLQWQYYKIKINLLK